MRSQISCRFQKKGGKMIKNINTQYIFSSDEIFEILKTHLENIGELNGEENLYYGFAGESDLTDEQAEELFIIYSRTDEDENEDEDGEE